MSASLERARQFESEHANNISPEERPVFHLSPMTGWMNDPNGFSRFGGVYHMFYQYHPYDTYWGPMHWGHAVSTDLLHWTYKPAALAPDMPYDVAGCFSGSAIELEDGRQMLIYTGVSKKVRIDGKEVDIQTQNLAFGDGTNFEKFGGNPVMAKRTLPEGGSQEHFRDPKIVKYSDGTYRCYTVNWLEGSGGCVLQQVSMDGIHWKLKGILAQNDFRIGRMWECPDFFPLGDKMILMCSMQDAFADGLEYDNGNGTFWAIGNYDDRSGKFEWESDSCIDYGIDFYAPQTILSEDGRRIMIGWMQNWDTIKLRTNEVKWYGQMSIPRELELIDGKIYQNPIHEFNGMRGKCIKVHDVVIDHEEINVEGMKGRVLDLQVDVEADDPEALYQKFVLRFAENEKFHSDFTFDPSAGTISIDRRYSGTRRAVIHTRTAALDGNGGRIRIRLILDRFSAEIFLNDGEKAMSMTLETPLDVDGISFMAEGRVRMNAVCYELKNQ